MVEDARKTLTLINQIMSAINRNRYQDEDKDSLSGVLSEINELTEPWRKANGTTTAPASQVMYALNPDTSAWAALNVSSDDIKTWQMFGYTPEYAKRWIEAGLNLPQAMKWAAVYNLKNYDPAEIAKWETHNALLDPYEVIRWLENAIPSERAIEWTLAGGNYFDGNKWLKSFPDVNPTKLFQTYQSGMSISQLRPWIEKNILGDAVAQFVAKGYTPAAAKKVIDAGHTPETAPDKKNGEPIPGRSWKQIATVAARIPGLKKDIKDNSHYFSCELTKPGLDELIVIRFRKSGQFVEANYHVPTQGYRYGRSSYVGTLSKLLEHLNAWAR